MKGTALGCWTGTHLQGAHTKEYQQSSGCNVVHWDAIEGQRRVCLVEQFSQGDLHIAFLTGLLLLLHRLAAIS